MSRSTSVSRLFILNGIALIGLILSLLLAFHYYEVRGESSHFKSFCNMGQAFNCDKVALSQSAELFAGLPIASFSAGWFLTFFLISLFAHKKFWKREALRAVFAITAVGSIICGIYFLIMKFQLQTFCIYCVGIDLCMVTALIVVTSLKPEGFSQHKLDFSKWKPFLGVGLASMALAVLGMSSFDHNSIQSDSIKEIAESILTSPSLPMSSNADFPSIGPASAPITIVEFSDFQCPFCRIGALNINTLLYRYPGKIRIVFRNFPLDQKCNFEFQQTMHPAACEAAKLALCAQEQGKFQSAYESLFEKQAAFVPGGLASLLKDSNLDQAQLLKCVDSPQTSTRINQDVMDGQALKIAGTPTFFVNGHKVEGIRPFQVWNYIVEKLLHE